MVIINNELENFMDFVKKKSTEIPKPSAPEAGAQSHILPGVTLKEGDVLGVAGPKEIKMTHLPTLTALHTWVQTDYLGEQHVQNSFRDQIISLIKPWIKFLNETQESSIFTFDSGHFLAGKYIRLPNKMIMLLMLGKAWGTEYPMLKVGVVPKAVTGTEMSLEEFMNSCWFAHNHMKILVEIYELLMTPRLVPLKEGE